MNPRRQIVAYFDFDGTISRKDTLVPFLVFVVGKLRFTLALPKLIPIVIRYCLGMINNEAAKQATLTVLLKGYSKRQVEHKAKQFALTHLNKYINPVAYAKIEWHREHGHNLFLVSANLGIYLRHWANLHKLDQVIATELEIDAQQCLTGRLLTHNCYGKQKVERIQDFLTKNKLNLNYAYAYGNSAGDFEMLEYADEPYYVSGEMIEAWEGRNG